MNLVTIEDGDLQTILSEQIEPDILVLRGAAMTRFVEALSAATGRPFDTKGAPCLHGIRRGQPHEPVHVDRVRDWYLGEPMPVTGADVREELRVARARIWQMEQGIRAAMDTVASMTLRLATAIRGLP